MNSTIEGGTSSKAVFSSGSAQVLSAQVITSYEELRAYAPEWNGLLAQSQANSIFLTWEWLSTWLETVGLDAPLLTVAIRNNGGELVAVAPFYRTTLRFLGLMSYKCLRFIGDCLCGSEYPDIIVRDDCKEEALALIMKTLLDCSSSWDCIYLPSVAGWTGAYERFHYMFARGDVFIHERSSEFSAIKLPDTHEAYLTQFSRKHRGNIRRATQRLVASHNVEMVRCGSEDTLPKSLQGLFDLHRRRWESVGQFGSFVRKPLMKRFYERFAPQALRRGWLRLFLLEVDGAMAAVQCGYAYNGSFSAIQEGRKPESFGAVGNILRNLAIEACIEEGLAEYDFLGKISKHKRLWHAESRGGYELFIGRKSLKNRPLFWKSIWPTGRYIQEGRPANGG